jgi:hypothetical protein
VVWAKAVAAVASSSSVSRARWYQPAARCIRGLVSRFFSIVEKVGEGKGVEKFQ